jgi:hypothetical protein
MVHVRCVHVHTCGSKYQMMMIRSRWPRANDSALEMKIEGEAETGADYKKEFRCD